MISTAVCIFVDYLFISAAMGTNGLTAFSLAVPVYAVVWGIGLMLGVGGGAQYAELRARRKNMEMNAIFTLTVKMCFAAGLPLLLAGVFLPMQLGALLGAEGDILPMTADYIRVILLLAPCAIFYNLFEGFARNDDAPRIAMISALIYNGMNIVLNYVFIIALAWGMLGAALATTLAGMLALLYLLFHWIRRRFHFRLVKTQIKARQMLVICEIGASPFMGEFLYGFILITFNLTLLRLTGNIGVAAFGIISSAAFIVAYIFTGLGQGLQPLASTYYGTKDRRGLSKVLRYAIVTSFIIAVVVIALTFVFSDALIAVLNTEQNAALAAVAHDGARIYFSAFAFVGVTTVASAFLSVTGFPRIGLVLAILQGGALIIPLVIILSHFFGISGVWAAYPAAELILTIVSVWFLLRTRKAHKSLERGA